MNTKTQKTHPRVKKTKVTNDSNWCSIRTRVSPRQLCIAIKGMTEKQKEAVRSLGFGKLLSIQNDGIPGRLGHYVVDNLDTDNMEINVGCVKIKIDGDAIHNLLGIRNHGIYLETFEYKKNCWDYKGMEKHVQGKLRYTFSHIKKHRGERR